MSCQRLATSAGELSWKKIRKIFNTLMTDWSTTTLTSQTDWLTRIHTSRPRCYAHTTLQSSPSTLVQRHQSPGRFVLCWVKDSHVTGCHVSWHHALPFRIPSWQCWTCCWGSFELVYIILTKHSNYFLFLLLIEQLIIMRYFYFKHSSLYIVFTSL